MQNCVVKSEKYKILVRKSCKKGYVLSNKSDGVFTDFVLDVINSC